MAYYSVAAVSERRVNDEDGTVEYAVQWDGYGDEITWERRQHLTENCAEMVQAVDQRCMDATDRALTTWRRTTWGRRRADQTLTPSVAAASSAAGDPSTLASSPIPPSNSVYGRKRTRSAPRADRMVGTEASTTSLDAEEQFENADADLEEPEVEESEENDVEVLMGLLLRPPQSSAVKVEDTSTLTTTEEGTVLMLGEVVLAEDASAALNHGSSSSSGNNNGSNGTSGGGGGGGGSGGNGRKRRPPTAARAALSLNTAPAMSVEKMWREMHGHSLLHSVEVSNKVTAFRDHFELRLPDAETRAAMSHEAHRSSHLRILSLAPPRATFSGAVYAASVALEGLVGADDVEEMRTRVQQESPQLGWAAQELTKPHVEQMVVRYMVSQTPSSTASSTVVQLEPYPVPEYVASMPLSVFRLAFPQLLIDYLLENSVVLH